MSELVTTTEKTYPDLVYSNFPDNLDKAIVFRDPSASETVVIQQYRSLYEAGQVAAAVDLLSKNPSLNDCIINAAKLLRLQDSIRAVQRYYFDDVQEKIFRLGNLKGDWNASMSTETTGNNHLQKFDVVRYPVDGVLQYFLVYGDVTAGMIPTENPDVYLQMSMKGEKGDVGYTPQKDIDYFDGYTPQKNIDYFDGYTPVKGVDYNDGYTPIKGIDYFDGVAGIGMSPRGAWLIDATYKIYDFVSHNGKMYYALEDNVGEEPFKESTIWVEFEISIQTSVGELAPSNLEDFGVWYHLQEDGHVVIKTKNENDVWDILYPETTAEYVKDIHGVALQEYLYNFVMCRPDIVKEMSCIENEDGSVSYTISAKLKSNHDIVICNNIVEDKTYVDGTCITTLTVYDNTGVYVLRKLIETIVRHDNGAYTKDTEIVI